MPKHLVRLLALLFLLLAPWTSIQAGTETSRPAESAAQPATLYLVNRPIVTFRTTLAGSTPAARVEHIRSRTRSLDPARLQAPLSKQLTTFKGEPALNLLLGKQIIITLVPDDVDPESHASLEDLGDEVLANLESARAVYLEQRQPRALLLGLFISLLATLGTGALLWGFRRLTQWILDHLRQRIATVHARGALGWASYGWVLIQRLAQLTVVVVWLTVAYLWLTLVLGQFPVTAPLGDRLGNFMLSFLGEVGNGALAAIPGMTAVFVLLFITKAINDVVSNVFQGVNQGRLEIPGLHRETATATRRIISLLIWGMGIAIAYPYLPLADSDAFKGLSFMFGFMLTLGSAGLVNQLMSGLVLVYSRALKVGDFVTVGETEGVVKEMGVLSTKIVNMRNEEITVPNAVLVGNPIKNYSRLAGDSGTLVSTKVTIGYDAPWRQIHAMLLTAAGRTPGLRASPPPFVMQRALQDFYVEYELFAHMDDPIKRIAILSVLHAQIQDEFNTHGVQIMSPHFALQPRHPVVIPPGDWAPPPAKQED